MDPHTWYQIEHANLYVLTEYILAVCQTVDKEGTFRR